MTSQFSYVLPLRLPRGAQDAREELAAYLRRLVEWCDDVIVVDGSDPDAFAANGSAWPGAVRHLPPDPAHACLMGKVPGVLTGLDLARHDRVVIADDDVRYERLQLARAAALLADAELVRPQNYFDPLPWHAIWDTGRTLLNRALGADFPGTLAVRRSLLTRTGGYDGDVLFENLELIRTVQAQGGRVVTPLDLYVRRLPPTTAHFLGQRTRQAYDDFALPARMALWLSILPVLLASMLRRRPHGPVVLAVAPIALAEAGRRRAGGAAVFPARASLVAPGWVLERAVCAWLALLQRMRYGGVRYGDSVIPVAAHSRRALRQRAGARGTQGDSPTAPSASSDCPPQSRNTPVARPLEIDPKEYTPCSNGSTPPTRSTTTSSAQR